MLQASFFRCRVLAAVSLTSLYAVAPTVSFTALLLSENSEVWGMTTISQTSASNLPLLSPMPPGGSAQSTPLPPGNAPVSVPTSSPTRAPTAPSTPPGTAPLSSPLPTPSDSGSQIQFQKYRLGPGDGIAIVVPRFPDLNFAAVINPEGNIISPLVGVVPLRGLTLEEAQERIRVALNRYVIDPIIILSLTSQRPVQASIIGEIAKPGFYPLGATRLPAALLAAGGTTARADLRAVRVRRTLQDGTIAEQTVDLFTPLVNGTALPEVRIDDGDVILVPKLEVGKDQDYDRALVARSTIIKPQMTIRVLSYPNNGVGTLTLPSGSTFADALAATSINLGTSNLKKIALIRFDPEQGKAISRELNGKKALTGDISQNVALQDNDVIVVGRNLVGKITNTLNVFTQPFRDVLGFLLFFQQLQQSAEDLFGP